jgi:hypothetical protein
MNKKEKKVLTGEATPEQIAMWKNLHGKVFHFEVDGGVCYLKRPSRNIVSAASTLGQTNPIKYAETLLENCWLDGDESIKTDDTKFLSVAGKLDALMQLTDVTVKEL